MKDEDEKKIQNQEDEVLNSQEEETVEGGVSDLSQKDTNLQPENGLGTGCDCIC